jgi:hypothetical protein
MARSGRSTCECDSMKRPIRCKCLSLRWGSAGTRFRAGGLRNHPYTLGAPLEHSFRRENSSSHSGLIISEGLVGPVGERLVTIDNSKFICMVPVPVLRSDITYDGGGPNLKISRRTGKKLATVA